MAEVTVGQQAKSIRGLTLHVLNQTKRAREQRELEGLQEIEETIKIGVAGLASEFPTWTEVHLEFGVLFIDASGQQDTEFDRPLFTYGGETATGGPIGLVACVTRWDVTERNEVTGCMISVGTISTDRARRFRGELHARFQGYGMVADAYGGSAEQQDVE